LVFGMFILVALFVAFCVGDPWVEIVQFVNRDAENCPTLALNGQKSAPFSGIAFDLQSGVIRPPTWSADCVASVGYGLNSFLSNVIGKNGYSVGISITSGNTTNGNLTFNDYFCENCSCAVANTATIPLNVCVKNGRENGQNYSRYFQITPKLPPGYTVVGRPTVPGKYTLSWYLASPDGGCTLSARTTQYANNQKCQKVNDLVYINGYCASSSSFTGCTSPNSDCNNCTVFNQPLTETCLADFTNFGSGPVGGVLLPNAVSKIIVYCASSTLTTSFIVALIFSVISIVF